MEAVSSAEAPMSADLSTFDDAATTGDVLSSTEIMLPPTSSTTTDQCQQPAEHQRPFDTGNRQIMVHGVRKVKRENALNLANEWLQTAKVKSMVKDGTIEKVKKPPYGSWMVITVSEETMVQPVIDFINSGTIEIVGSDQGLRAHRAENNNGKRKDRHTGAERSEDAKRVRKEVEEDVVFISEDLLRDKVTPLWKLSEAEQKEKKVKELVRKCARKITQEVNARFRYVL